METEEVTFYYEPAQGKKLPILLSVPHCGTQFPAGLEPNIKPKVVELPTDTDWHVHKLYEFAPSLGIAMIQAKYSRYVVDLNRDSEGSKLYGENRLETSMVPTHQFNGESLYLHGTPEPEEILRRKKLYYEPYHNKIAEELQSLVNEFGQALLFDAHSIKHFVATISKEKFADLTLGDNQGKTASANLIALTCDHLNEGPYSFNHNEPFKGGYITRHFGQPNNNIHGLQLEMSQQIYMDEKTNEFLPELARPVQNMLQELFHKLGQALI